MQLKEPVLKGKGCRWGGKRYQNDKQTAREVGNGSDRSPIARLLIYHWLDSTRTRAACRRGAARQEYKARTAPNAVMSAARNGRIWAYPVDINGTPTAFVEQEMAAEEMTLLHAKFIYSIRSWVGRHVELLQAHTE